MLFNSIPFLVFAILFFAGYRSFRKHGTSRWIWICLMSFLFYGWWDWRFLFLLIGTGSLDYYCGKKILEKRHALFWLRFSIISNIAALALFKYSAWLADTLNDLFAYLEIGLQLKVPAFSLILPIGISFYTFNSLSYTIDLYRGKADPAKNWLHFMSFISFFPHLVAGPIIRARDVLFQLDRPVHPGALEILNGIKLCIWGFFQKMVLADNLALMVNDTFSREANLSGTAAWWMCMFAFAFQIYFDFNGYSSIARGLAKLCGIHFRLNFNHPYLSGSFSEFWRRWHISLSSFFKDYVYITMGGNRKGKLRTELNRWFTMLLSGLWHGANFTFLIWGALHAFFLSIEHHTQSVRKALPDWIRSLRYPLVFISVTLAWVFFRAPDLSYASDVFIQMFSFRDGLSLAELFKSNSAVWLLLAFTSELLTLQYFSRLRQKHVVLTALQYGILLAMILFFRGPEQDFIYFQF